MKVSPTGRKAIAEREGNKLAAYKCSAGVWTIGVGHTSAAGLPAVKAGMRITAEESDEILSRDLAAFEKAVLAAVKAPLTQNQFDALVSLAFNIGSGAFAKSTLVKRLNARDYKAAAEQFLVWNKAGGRVLKGLETRRYSERAQFLKADSRLIEHITAPEPAPVVPVETYRSDGKHETPPGLLSRFWTAFKKRIAA